jgi:membrane protein YdbS with pleckstrin-like domain
MNPMKRPVASVLRLIGVGLVLLSVVLLALLWIAHERAPEPWWRWALYALPAIGGVVVVASSGRLAARLTRDFEE